MKNTIKILIYLILPLIFCTHLNAYFELSAKSNRSTSMNGVEFSKYKDFAKKWQLVTVRYRQDSQEMRFIYANDIAWKAMKSFAPNYPDGAIFGKVGMVGEADPAFPSSIVPSGSRRYQFMVKDKRKYKSTDGWGYALFDASGQLFESDVKKATAACAACHRLVPERDYVFARSFALNERSLTPQLYEVSDVKSRTKNKITFETIAKKNLPSALASQMPEKFKKVESLAGEIKKNAFSGTLDEIVPQLILVAQKSGTPATLVIDNKNFSLVYPEENPLQNCQEGKSPVKVIVMFNAKLVRNAEICQ